MSTIAVPQDATIPTGHGQQQDRAVTAAPLTHDALHHAVREGAARATVVAGLAGLIAVHAVDAVGKWTETPYIFWMYMAAIAAAIATAGWTLFTRSRTALLASAAVAGSVLLGYVINRTVGLPSATGDIGNWTEPIGITSMVIEAATVAVSLGAYAAGRRGPT